MYDVSAQGIDECMINVHYYYHVYIHVFFFICSLWCECCPVCFLFKIDLSAG